MKVLQRDLQLHSQQRPAKENAVRPATLILLAGAVRPVELCEAAGRPILQLPVDQQHNILDLWTAHAEIHSAYSGAALPIRVITNVADTFEKPRGAAQVESDPLEMRGSGGVLRDAVEFYSDDTIVAVATASQILLEPLSQLLSALAQTQADVAMIAHDDGSPSGILLARCAALRIIPRVGYIDLKEQALPMIAKHFSVRAARWPGSAGALVRTRANYIAALRRYHCPHTADSNPFAEDWADTFSVKEAGADVDAGARLHDSVVLKGGRVGRDAIVARSVVCDGGIVEAGRTVIDQVVCRR